MRGLTGILALFLLLGTATGHASDVLIELPERWAGTLEAIPGAELGGQPKDVQQTLTEARQMAINALQADAAGEQLAEAYGERFQAPANVGAKLAEGALFT